MLSFFVVGVSLTVEQSLIAKYLYKESRNHLHSDNKNVTAKKNQILVPNFLEAKYVFNAIFCCCKIKKFAKYQKDLQKVENDVNMNIDLI